LKGAELLLNSDAGGAYLGDDGKPTVYSMQAAEKTYMDFEVTTTNPGGHSSRPGPTNAIADLARAIDKVAAFRFPARLSDLTKAYFKAAGPITPGKSGEMMLRYAANPDDKDAYEYLHSQPEYVGQLGTTCVPTMLRGGHAPNALPQSATANINCRVFPGETVEYVQSTLVKAIDDPKAQVKLVSHPVPSDASPLRDDVMKALRKAIDLRAPGLPIVPSMSAGATDSLYFRNLGVPSYGVGGIFMHVKDSFAHGLNERIPVASIDGAVIQWRSLLRDLSR
jgi:acetylornithine deacetylase/succinyl-diaminopimelate desuccinylase-like protein